VYSAADNFNAEIRLKNCAVDVPIDSAEFNFKAASNGETKEEQKAGKIQTGN